MTTSSPAEPHLFDSDGLTTAPVEEPQPALKFISKGFSRGAAPDNLVFLPFGGREAREPQAPRAQGDVCSSCGDLGVVRQGAIGVCQTCGAQDGLAGDTGAAG